MSFCQITFSATGRTKAVADLLASVWGEERRHIDLSAPSWTAPAPFADEDICLVTVPAFGGRVPTPAAARLPQLKGNGATAILVATFGNRAIDDTLLELKNMLEAQGFRCRAAMEVSTEHSIMPQFGAGRPDADDKTQLLTFARQIKDALESGTLPQTVKVPGNAPYKEMGDFPLKPKADKSCVQCGLCAAQCPVGAIPADDPTVTNKDQCISCMRCISICPQQARSLPSVMLAGISTAMGKAFAGRKPNALYLD